MKKSFIVGIVVAVVIISALTFGYIYEYSDWLIPAGDASGCELDVGKSDIYTEKDIEKAAKAVYAKFKGFGGCKLLTMKYKGDSFCEESVSYCNDIGKKKTYKHCIVFDSCYVTGSRTAGDSGLNSDQTYDGWSWYVAREEGGAWEVIGWGYA